MHILENSSSETVGAENINMYKIQQLNSWKWSKQKFQKVQKIKKRKNKKYDDWIFCYMVNVPSADYLVEDISEILF